MQRKDQRRGVGGSSAHTPINNPSYNTNPALWHSIALQQQRLADLKIDNLNSLSSGVVGRRRLTAGGRVAVVPGRSQQQQQQQQQRRDGDDYDDDDDDDEHRRPRPTLTLAQRMGLAEAPEPELDRIGVARDRRNIARSRNVQGAVHHLLRTVSRQPAGPALLRPCLPPHVPPQLGAPLKEPLLPVCRKQHYRKRGIDDGANLYRDECAVRVQAAWRGARARKATAKQLRHLNPARRRKYAEQRLSGLTDQLLGAIEAERSAVDELFAEIDSTVAASRVLLSDADGLDWRAIESQARERGLGDCPVCLSALCGAGGAAGREPLALLSCSHVFHKRCLASFERFSVAPVCLCPVCRSAYSKHHITASGDPPPPSPPAPAHDDEVCGPCEPDDAPPRARVDGRNTSTNGTASSGASSRRTARALLEDTVGLGGGGGGDRSSGTSRHGTSRAVVPAAAAARQVPTTGRAMGRGAGRVTTSRANTASLMADLMAISAPGGGRGGAAKRYHECPPDRKNKKY